MPLKKPGKARYFVTSVEAGWLNKEKRVYYEYIFAYCGTPLDPKIIQVGFIVRLRGIHDQFRRSCFFTDGKVFYHLDYRDQYVLNRKRDNIDFEPLTLNRAEKKLIFTAIAEYSSRIASE